MKISKIYCLLVLTILTYFTAPITCIKATTLKSDLHSKFCPLINFNGKPYCPGRKTVGMKSGGKSVQYIRSGFGFDRATKEIKFPVFASTKPSRISGQSNDVKRFNNVRQFFNFVLGEKRDVTGGLFVSNENTLRRFGSKFAIGDVNVGVTQKLYFTHQTNIQNNNPITEFQSAVNFLPAYNRNSQSSVNSYRMVIRFFGTDVATFVRHGGIIFQQTMVKLCYGGNINGDMINDLDSIISRRAPNSGYLRYRRLGLFESRGGNPEFGNNRLAQRIQSFATAPAPIQFKSIPIWEAIKDANKRKWMKLAVNDYLNQFKPTTESIIKKVEQDKQNNWRKNQRLYLVDSNHEQHGQRVINWTGCPRVRFPGRRRRRWFRRRRSPDTYYTPRCALLRPVISLSAGGRTDNVVGRGSAFGVFVERDSGSGNVRIRSVKDGRSTPWLRRGCGVLRFNNNILGRHICVGVIPHIVQSNAGHNQRHTDIRPVCEHF